MVGMKTRLTKDMRYQLLDLSRTRIKDPEHEEAWKTAQRAAQKAAIKAFHGMYPVKEMAVLKKYDVTIAIDKFGIALRESDHENIRYEWFHLLDKSCSGPIPFADQPLRPHGSWNMHVHLGLEASKLVDAFLTIDAARAKSRQEMLDTFDLVIRNAKNLEEIEAVWPAAKEIRRNIPALPMVRLAPAFDKIREAVAAKLA